VIMRRAIFGSLILLGLAACGLDDQTPYLVTLTPAPSRVASATLPPPVVVVETSTPVPATQTPGPTQTPAATQGPTDTPVPPTNTPVPPPTEPPWPEPLAEPGASKMGIHVILNNDPRIMEFVRRVKPRVIKAIDSHGWLTEAKQASPQSITIGRFGRIPIFDDLRREEPVGAAQKFVDYFLNEYHLNPGVDYWEGLNEFQPKDDEGWNWFTQFEATRVCYMNSLGLKAAIGSFSTGTPEYADMEKFLPAIEAAKRCNGIFSLHEYSAPTMQTAVNGGIPNAVFVQDAGALTLRYRYWYEGYLKPRNLVIPLVLTEAGVDGDVGPGCPMRHGGSGWQACFNDWEAANPGVDKYQYYLSQLEWYDSEVRKDDYVLGFTVFSAGTSDNDLWKTFGINDLLVPMAIYMAGQH